MTVKHDAVLKSIVIITYSLKDNIHTWKILIFFVNIYNGIEEEVLEEIDDYFLLLSSEADKQI